MSGGVGFDVHHGYGKKKIDNVAVIDRIEHIDGQLRRWEREKSAKADRLADYRAKLSETDDALRICEAEAREHRASLAARITAGKHRDPSFADQYDRQRLFERWTAELAERARLQALITEADPFVAERVARIKRVTTERAVLEHRRRIFTVDVELDEIMTGFKFTFLNLCGVLMDRFLGVHLEITTLVLTLPGVRIASATTETIRIFRPRRDARAIEAVERACAALNARALVRGSRALRFEMADADPSAPTDAR